MAEQYRALIFDPKTFSERIPENCIVLDLSNTFNHDCKGAKNANITSVVHYDAQRHDEIMNSIVNYCKRNGFQVVVHGYKVGRNEEDKTAAVLKHLAKHNVHFVHSLSKTQLERLSTEPTAQLVAGEVLLFSTKNL
ncbi:MAG TPA: hypothetical protein VI875_01425 [Candidatus Norongarragalinales archaeon]|nr:hypothetical protein [Candidatus Norongarragalinales archaeon]